MIHVAVPRESVPGETRVALVPETVSRLVAAGYAVVVEQDAGAAASFSDDAYRTAGATIAPSFAAACEGAGVVLKVQAPSLAEVESLREGSVLIAFLATERHPELIPALAARRISAFAMERVPRISRAQKMDALSSMASIAGYKAVLVAAGTLGKFFPLMMTAAGTIAPARVFVIGAGVAGLQAIATARRLGAVVEAFDVRPAVKEEVQSLGATFVAAEVLNEGLVDAGGYARAQSADQQQLTRDKIAKHVASADVVISTASVPGKRAPMLISAELVRGMKAGSVIVDLAAESGGNCELTAPGRDVVAHGVNVLGPVNLVATVPVHASQMYSRNLAALLGALVKDGVLALDFTDEVVFGACVTHDGASLVDRPAPANGTAPAATVPARPAPEANVRA
jgi:NAD(P) transhydrogenase subunit alpha